MMAVTPNPHRRIPFESKPPSGAYPFQAASWHVAVAICWFGVQHQRLGGSFWLCDRSFVNQLMQALSKTTMMVVTPNPHRRIPFESKPPSGAYPFPAASWYVAVAVCWFRVQHPAAEQRVVSKTNPQIVIVPGSQTPLHGLLPSSFSIASGLNARTKHSPVINAPTAKIVITTFTISPRFAMFHTDPDREGAADGRSGCNMATVGRRGSHLQPGAWRGRSRLRCRARAMIEVAQFGRCRAMHRYNHKHSHKYKYNHRNYADSKNNETRPGYGSFIPY